MAKGKHMDHRIVFYRSRNAGRHAKNEIIKYNKFHAKLNAGLGSLAVAASFITCVTLGKFKGTLAGEDNARVARYVLELTEPDTTITEFIPSTTRNIDFQVKNYKGDEANAQNTSEVKLKYRISVELPATAKLPLDYKLYRVYDESNEEEVTLTNGRSEYVMVSTASEVHSYRLDITWQDGHDEIDYQNLTDSIIISAESEQID